MMRRINTIKRRKYSQGRTSGACGGFTLAETLLAVLILLLVSVIVATGVPVAQNAYEKIILGANAQAMLSTAATSMRDELGTAWKVENGTGSEANKVIYFFNADTGAKSSISLAAGTHADGSAAGFPAIMLTNYLSLEDDLIHDKPADGSVKTGDAYRLVPDGASRLYVTFDTISYDNSQHIVTVTGLKVCRQSNNKVIAELKNSSGVSLPLVIRVLT